MTPFFISAFDDHTLHYGAQLLFRSPDRGRSWPPSARTYPPQQFTTSPYIAVHRREREIVIGTHGRSAFLLDVGPILR